MNGDPVDYADFAREWAWLRPRHGGDVEAGALAFGVPVSALVMRLRRCRSRGFDVSWTEYTTKERAS
jgi:hypothetical protein